MKLSMNWAKDFVDVSDIPIKDYCDKLTDTGSKVEGYEVLGSDIENVVVGKILKITKHPDSDHLQICQIDCGEEAPRQIVTGAQNVFEGAVVPVAKAPAKLPGGVVIKAGKLRGEDSNGMLCSIAELGLTLHEVPYAIEDGIFIMNEDCKVGDDIRDVMLLNDNVVEFEITSNRPDCLSVIGLARESAASYGRAFSVNTPVVTETDGNIADYLSVDVENGALCRRYAARVVKNVKIEPSPLWMRMRLRAAGVRPINNIVDITNYVMLEYGQPMHAFDYAMLDGKKIVVRNAFDGEIFKSLDDIDHTLTAKNLVIADEKKAVALAGVMGGANSEIKDSTVTVVFESANFDGATVRVGAKSQGMRTESSARFEKGLDPENVMPALDRACELVTLLGAGEVVCGSIDVYKGKSEPVTLPLNVDAINHFLGVNLSRDYMVKVLTDLEFKVEGDTVTAPSFRADITCMNDVAEEIIRMYGYNNIESTPFRCNVKAGMLTPKQNFEKQLHGLLCGMGINECMNFSFVSPKNVDKIALSEDAPERKCVVISNPLGEDTGVMRTTLVPGLLEVLARNNNFHSEAASLYELARIYIPDENPENLPEERKMLAFGFYGEGDYYALKGMTDNIIEFAGLKNVRYVADSEQPTFHPGRCAVITARGGREAVGVLGEIHPAVGANYGFSAPVYVAYLNVDKLFELSDMTKQYKPLPKYPATTRDFSFVCDKSLEAASVEDVMKKAGGKLVEKVELFDVYTGEKIGLDNKSVAFRVTMRAADHTLTDEEADKTSQKILASLEKNLGITLRR